jgi:hypothetical protein
MAVSASILPVIQQRYSCRNYASTPLNDDTQRAVSDYLQQLLAGPFQKSNRFVLAAATDQERSTLRGLGTYGFIKNPPAFIIGASVEGSLTLEDFGYCMEQIVLQMTRLGLGTCWLGGTFTRSAFAQRLGAGRDEILPAVLSLGYPSQEDPQAMRLAQQLPVFRERNAWQALFFEESFNVPLTPEASGAYATPLEMVRLAPSASNKQPWRILRQGDRWHLYLQRTKGYREMALGRFTGIADMQRIDMGIAMCHFELAARDCGLSGKWMIDEPQIARPDVLTHYVVSWVSDPLVL